MLFVQFSAVLDIFLAIGAHHDNVCAMIFWQIWNMIIIVCYFCQWTVIPILVSMSRVIAKGKDSETHYSFRAN